MTEDDDEDELEDDEEDELELEDDEDELEDELEDEDEDEDDANDDSSSDWPSATLLLTATQFLHLSFTTTHSSLALRLSATLHACAATNSSSGSLLAPGGKSGMCD